METSGKYIFSRQEVFHSSSRLQKVSNLSTTHIHTYCLYYTGAALFTVLKIFVGQHHQFHVNADVQRGTTGRRSLALSNVNVHYWFAATSLLTKCVWAMAVSQHQFYLERKKLNVCLFLFQFIYFHLLIQIIYIFSIKVCFFDV